MLISYFQFLEDLAVICIDRNFLLCFMYMDDIKKNIGKDVIDDTFAERLKIQGNRDRTEDVAAYRQNERKKKMLRVTYISMVPLREMLQH